MDIDYIKILNFIKDYAGLPYSDPDKEKDPINKKKLEDIKSSATDACNQLKEVSGRSKELFDLIKDSSCNWTDGSHTKIRNYLWLQLKKDRFKDSPISISVFVEKNNGVPRFRISLEIYNNKAKDNDLATFHSHLDLPLENGVVNVSGSNEYGDPTEIENIEEAKQIVDAGGKVQRCIYVESDPTKSNKEYDTAVMDAIARLIPYYDYVLNKYSNKGAAMNSLNEISDFTKLYAKKLLDSKNLIFRGAPGTGKSYLAKQIASYLASDERTESFEELNDDEKKQIEFVQFHPSYDYTDFVEGLRPVNSENGNVGFKLQDGVFTQFIKRAKTNFENSKKDDGTLKKEKSVDEAISNFLENVDVGNSKFYSYSKNEFIIIDYDEETIKIYIPNNKQANKLNLKISDIRKLLEADEVFGKMRDIQNFFKASYGHQAYTYYLTLYKKIRELMTSNVQIKKEPLRKYVFIIDEINRGEVSKIFGELFFSIDPGYRGKAGEVSTQYQNLHDDPNDKFYIPENVYIIGTMNDIDRSVDTFDFAMRRRFRFIEIKPESCVKMLDGLSLKDDAINRMKSLNKAIVETEGLNENYQIGPSYFLKLKEIDFDDLWADYLKPLLEEYIRGLSDESEIMDRFEKAYNGADNESSEA